MTSPAPQSPHVCLLLGKDELRYGEYRLETSTETDVVCTLSVGATPDTPASAAKGDPALPNEDALLVVDDGVAALAVVADAHFGTAASHELLAWLADRIEAVPRSPRALDRLLRGAVEGSSARSSRSETTLLAVVVRRDLRAGFGVSVGDSVCAVLGDGAPARYVNRLDSRFVRPGGRWRGAPIDAAPFDFELPQAGLVLAYTDGISCCHYDHPGSSIGTAELDGLWGRIGANPRKVASSLTEQALSGLPGAPGGQDNIALVVVPA